MDGVDRQGWQLYLRGICLIVALAVVGSVSAITTTPKAGGAGKWKKWTAWIAKDGNYICGASVIDKNWLLTSADCIESLGTTSSTKDPASVPFVKVYLGDYNVTADDQQQQVRSCNLVKNPKYDSLTDAYNLALLQLERPAALDRDTIAMVPAATTLIKHKVLKQSSCLLTGWQWDFGSPSVGINIPIKIMNSAKCDGLSKFDASQHICYEAVDAYPCPGDIGLPISCEIDGKWTQVGVQLSQSCAPGYHFGAQTYKSRSFITDTKTQLSNETCRDPPPDLGCGPKGLSFLVSYPAPDPVGSRPTLYITSWEDTMITLVPGADLVPVFANFTKVYKVTAFNGLVINLPASLAIHSNGISSKGLRIIADDMIYVMAGYEPDAIATTQLFPEECLSTFGFNYLPLGFSGGFGQLSELLIVAMTDSTLVDITGTGFTDQFTLNGGQLYRVDRDASGLRVSANAALAVFVGVRCANVAPDVAYCDTLYEQIQPEDTLQNSYILPSLLPRKNIYMRVIGTEDATTVQYKTIGIGGTETSFSFDVNNQGVVDSQIMDVEAVALLANSPVVIGKFGYGGEKDLLLFGDPALLMTPALQEFTDKYVLYGPSTLGFNRMAVIIPPADIPGLLLNGYPLTGSLGNVTVGPYMILYEPMCYGVHRLHHNKEKPFGVVQYNMEYYREAVNAPRRLYASGTGSSNQLLVDFF